MSLISQLVTAAGTVTIGSSTSDSVQSGFNMKWDAIIKRQASFNNNIFISYVSGMCENHSEDQKMLLREYDISAYIKTTDIETTVENFITVFDGLVLNDDTQDYFCEVQAWIPVRDNLTDVIEIILKVYG